MTDYPLKTIAQLVTASLDGTELVPLSDGGVTEKASLNEIIAALSLATDGEVSAAVAAHATNTNNPHVVTKAQVGLGNVDNTSDATKRINAGPITGLRNKLINPLGTINQEAYVSGTATTGANQYTLDQWYVLVSGQSLSWTESAGLRTFTAPAGGVGQKIEGASLLSGTHTISWTGTATCTVDGVAKVSGDTVTLTGGTLCTVVFSGGTFSKPQLEPGAYATEFEQRHPQQERALCQRFFCIWDLAVAGAYSSGGAGATAQARAYFPVEMRAIPTILNGTPTTVNISASSYSMQNTRGITYSITQGGATGNFSAQLSNYKASARL